jgi:hypothetical protein
MLERPRQPSGRDDRRATGVSAHAPVSAMHAYQEEIRLRLW